MSQMGIDQWISLASCVVAALSAIATLFTVLQMQWQRREAFKPRLALQSTIFTILPKDDDSDIANHWFTGIVENGNLVSDLTSATNIRSDFLKLKLANLGLGAATNIRLHWSFNVTEFIDTVSNIALKNKRNIKIERINQRMVSFSGDFAMIANLGAQEYKRIDYLTTEKPHNVDVPLLYLKLVSLYYACAVYSFDEMEEFDAYPPLKLDIEYSDISDNHYSHSFIIKTDTHSAGRHEVNGELIVESQS